MKKKYLNKGETNMLHMEQNSYQLQIVGVLLKKNSHIREIARKLDINHMSVTRRIKELLDNNVVDFIQEGKNQNYYLKKNVEARAYVLMFEHYRLFEFLRKNPFLRDITGKIQRDSRIKLALFFGSYVKELQTKKSDIDIFIETNNLKIKTDYSCLDSKFSIKIGKLDKNELSKEIEKNHVIIKGGEYYYENYFE